MWEWDWRQMRKSRNQIQTKGAQYLSSDDEYRLVFKVHKFRSSLCEPVLFECSYFPS